MRHLHGNKIFSTLNAPSKQKNHCFIGVKIENWQKDTFLVTHCLDFILGEAGADLQRT